MAASPVGGAFEGTLAILEDLDLELHKAASCRADGSGEGGCQGKAKDQVQLIGSVFDGATCFRKIMGPHGLAQARASGLKRINAGFDVDVGISRIPNHARDIEAHDLA